MPTQPVIERLKELQTELETVSAAVKHIDKAANVAKTTSEILKKIPELINDLKVLEENHRQALIKIHKEKIDILEKLLQSLLIELKVKSKQFYKLIDETKKLENTISNYYSEIKKINFPERLDKIDNQISAINIGVGNLHSLIQNIQTKVDTVQSTFNLHTQLIDKKFSYLENIIVAENVLLKKQIKTNRIIQVVGFVFALTVLIYLVVK